MGRKLEVSCADNNTHMERTCPHPALRLSGCAIVDQNEMNRHHLIVICFPHDQENVIKSHILIDCSATGYAFIDEDHAHGHQLPLHLLKSPRNLAIIDGRPVTSGTITPIPCTCPAIHNHQDDIPHFLTKLGHYPMVSGIPWLR
jgi:hypothetical protein